MAENRAKTPEKQEKTPLFRLASVEKHRTSQGQTSVLLGQNLGTFPRRSPMFPSFRQKRPQKGPFRILRYFGTNRMPVAFEGLLSPLSAPHILLTYIKYTARDALHTASQRQHKAGQDMEESMRSLRLIAGNAHRPKMKPELRLGTCVQKRSKHTGDARSSGSFFVDYAERGGRRRSQTMFNRILFLRNDFRGVGAHDAADVP